MGDAVVAITPIPLERVLIALARDLSQVMVRVLHPSERSSNGAGRVRESSMDLRIQSIAVIK